VTELRARGARVVVVGHSYGGLVAARAEARGMDADELVLLGAPGLGVGGLRELGLAPGADVWAATARLDPIALVARAGLLHGRDPADVARVLPTSLDGHGAYLRDPVLLDALAVLALEGASSERVAQEGAALGGSGADR
jgi:pimeloyl-ACP methyl ester carboxylesterase